MNCHGGPEITCARRTGFAASRRQTITAMVNGWYPAPVAVRHDFAAVSPCQCRKIPKCFLKPSISESVNPARVNDD
jgi:hypothetical protein